MSSHFASKVAVLAVVTAATFGSALPALAAPGVPRSLDIVGDVYTNDITPTFTWTPGNGATWYEVLVDNGNWAGIGNVTNYTLWPMSNGFHTFYLRSHDSSTSGVSMSVSVTFEIDTKGPTVPAPTPDTASLNVATTYSVTPTGESPTKWCWLIVDGSNVGAMTLASNGKTFTKSYTFTTSGSHTVAARCADGDNNYTTGTSRTISIGGSSTSTSTHVAKGTAVKTSSSSAVYYYGTDGRKHLFPTESVYYSWFGSYSNVVTITRSYFNSMPIGENVTYRPGTVLVKFASSTTVYAISKDAVLHPIANESVARSIYGSSWAASIVTVSDALRGNYTIGSTITSSSQYNKTTAYYSVSSIDENF